MISQFRILSQICAGAPGGNGFGNVRGAGETAAVQKLILPGILLGQIHGIFPANRNQFILFQLRIGGEKPTGIGSALLQRIFQIPVILNGKDCGNAHHTDHTQGENHTHRMDQPALPQAPYLSHVKPLSQAPHL